MPAIPQTTCHLRVLIVRLLVVVAVVSAVLGYIGSANLRSANDTVTDACCPESAVPDGAAHAINPPGLGTEQEQEPGPDLADDDCCDDGCGDDGCTDTCTDCGCCMNVAEPTLAHILPTGPPPRLELRLPMPSHDISRSPVGDVFRPPRC